MNAIFFGLIAIAYATTVYCQWLWSLHPSQDPAPMTVLTEQLLHAANDAVTLGIGLIGVLALFLGLMKIIETSGLLNIIAKCLSPLLQRLFPEIPRNHPAMGAMVMNLSANMLGMGNAATPFGLKAMQELEKLNPQPGIASNAMILFLAINTSCVTLLPAKVIALRTAAGSADPASIIATTLFATLCSMVIGIIVTKWIQRFSSSPILQQESTQPLPSIWISVLALGGLISLIPLIILGGAAFTIWLIPTFIVCVLAYGLYKKVDLYTQFVEGAKGGIETAIKIMPYLVAILVAVAMFRGSGALYYLTDLISPLTDKIGLPAEALPMVFMRPLSGSGSLGILADVLNNPNIGPDSYTGYLVSTMMGSTETTFYVLAIYFGSVQIKKIRHALAAGLIVECTGMMASIIAVNWLLT
jgi:spore maturation protein SpmA